MTYEDAMRDYGVDKPDLRVPLKLAELTDVVKDVDFKVFSGPANTAGGRVAALCVPGGGAMIAQRDRRLHRVPARTWAPRASPGSR